MTDEAVYGVKSCLSGSGAEIDDAHLHLVLGISADDPEGDLLAKPCVFEKRGQVGGGLRALTVGGDDDVADRAGAWIEWMNPGLISGRTAPHAEDHDAAHAELRSHALISRGDTDARQRRAALRDDLLPADDPDSEMMAVVTPMSRPELSSRGPPELPGLMAASV